MAGFTPGTVEPEKTTMDLDKLAYAVSQAETSNCTKGSGVSYLNCFGIMEWTTGTRRLKRYKTTDESFEDFKRIWSKHYVRYPDLAMAIKWTGNDNATRWLSIVNQYYN